MDLLRIDEVWATFEEDLSRRGVDAKRPRESVTTNEEWMATLSAAYINEPASS